MININSKMRIVEVESELPDFRGCKDLFLDLETKNNTEHLEDGAFKEYSGFYPYKGDRIGSFAVTGDNCPEVYYVPMRHVNGNNIDLKICLRWLQDHMSSCKNWVNHNVKFDALFLHCEGIRIKCELVDTLTLSKVHDSDRLGHSLKDLCRNWLKMPMDEELIVQSRLKAQRTRDYMRIPIDIMGKYACMDVFGNRVLYKFLLAIRPSDLIPIWDMEIKLSSVLFDMEIEGLKINKRSMHKELFNSLHTSDELHVKLEDLTNREFRDSNKWIADVLINELGLPILKTIKERILTGGKRDTGRATFDKDALLLYKIHPKVINDDRAAEIINALMEYRLESQFQSLYCVPFSLLKDDNDVIHPRYNAVVRTGRMSSSMPNIQQQNKRSKKLIMPHEGYAFISADYSQIEFRLIVHYIKDQDAIDAYNKDPNTDFHQWVMDLIGTSSRRAAKIVSFGACYGQGKLGVTTQLAGNPDVIESITEELKEAIKNGEIEQSKANLEFESRCRKRGNDLYNTFHSRLPGIKLMAGAASSKCNSQGYVTTAYGRRRHLPKSMLFRAFNSCIQGTAMDIIKEAMIKLSPRYNEFSRQIGLKVSINVHDEVVSMVPEDRMLDPEVHKHIINILESPSVKFTVPIKTSLGVSKKSWYEASSDETIRDSTGEIIAGKII